MVDLKMVFDTLLTQVSKFTQKANKCYSMYEGGKQNLSR